MTFVFAGALMFTSGFLIDKSATKPLFAAIYVTVVLTRAFGIGRPVFQYIERLTSHNWVLRITSHMRRKLYKVLETDAAFVSEHHQTGDILGLLADDIGHIQNLYLRMIFPTVVGAGLTVIATLLLGWFNWGCALWIMLLLLFQVLILPWWGLVVERFRKAEQKQLNHDAYVSLTDSVLGLSDWVITHREKDFMSQSLAAPKKLAASTVKSKRFQWRRDFVGQLLFVLIVISMLIWTNLEWTGNQASANWVCTGCFPTRSGVFRYRTRGWRMADIPRCDSSSQRFAAGHATITATTSSTDSVQRDDIAASQFSIHAKRS